MKPKLRRIPVKAKRNPRYSPGHVKSKECRYTAKGFLGKGTWSRLDTNDVVLARLHIKDVKTGYVQDNLMRSVVVQKGMQKERKAA